MPALAWLIRGSGPGSLETLHLHKTQVHVPEPNLDVDWHPGGFRRDCAFPFGQDRRVAAIEARFFHEQEDQSLSKIHWSLPSLPRCRQQRNLQARLRWSECVICQVYPRDKQRIRGRHPIFKRYREYNLARDRLDSGYSRCPGMRSVT